MSKTPLSSDPNSSPLRSQLPEQMDLEQLRYSMVWEDIELLYQGLDIQPGEHVLSIGSAGDNVLNLLLRDPARITAIDLSSAQNALLELKIGAIQGLEHEEFLILLGMKEGTQTRRALYQQIHASLPVYAQTYWDRQQEMLEKGVYSQGRLEQYFQNWREKEVFSRHSKKEILTYLQTEHPDREAAFHKMWGSPEFRRGFVNFFGAKNLARQGRDPAQFRFVEEQDVGSYFFQRFQFVCTQLPIKHNGYLHTFLLGKPHSSESFPPYLQKENFVTLRERLDRIELVSEELETFLPQQRPEHFHKGNFSDLFEYVSESHFQELLQMIHRAFRPGGRIAYWNLLVPRKCPPLLEKQFRYLEPLSQRLWKQDRSWFYRDFVIEERLP